MPDTQDDIRIPDTVPEALGDDGAGSVRVHLQDKREVVFDDIVDMGSDEYGTLILCGLGRHAKAIVHCEEWRWAEFIDPNER